MCINLLLLIFAVSLCCAYALLSNKVIKCLEKEKQNKENQRGGRYVVSAAIRYKNGVTLVGVRHWDGHMHEQAIHFRATGVIPPDEPDPEQGFLDNKGKFMTRGEAWVVAKAADQIRYDSHLSGTLYSEHLY